ncbi:hypothetical protein M5C72_08435 [Companilactobacillus allii]|uniref:Uncharacterized protein n=1 Tax=Companilactobacillus allii TaxID=1847728 RepID=A0A1P8Q5I6_9LACO|nr:hypothetical protein [Companilactobacillus allii]APX73108.1 hypothetical protein BTM29_11340 [Companilactobacillus allii]USQ67909.1 hypothetical protein M5C72_08435 [Companilactobacillus allii]
MKKLNIQKLTQIDSGQLTDRYESDYMTLLKEKNILTVQVADLQNLINQIYENSPEAIPEGYLTEDKK